MAFVDANWAIIACRVKAKMAYCCFSRERRAEPGLDEHPPPRQPCQVLVCRVGIQLREYIVACRTKRLHGGDLVHLTGLASVFAPVLYLGSVVREIHTPSHHHHSFLAAPRPLRRRVTLLQVV